MKTFFLIILLTFGTFVYSQTILNSPEEAKRVKDIDYENIVWTEYQQPHYILKGFESEYLDSDFFRRKDFEKAEAVLMEKINTYREIMGRGSLVLNDTASFVCREYAKELSKRKKLTHTLNGKTPYDRTQPYFPYPINIAENLVRYGSTLKFECVDSFTDYILHSWINSKGHNTILLDEGTMAGVGIYTLVDNKKNQQVTVAVFSVIGRR
jgi:uncharacterized protein YkwD